MDSAAHLPQPFAARMKVHLFLIPGHSVQGTDVVLKLCQEHAHQVTVQLSRLEHQSPPALGPVLLVATIAVMVSAAVW